MKPAAEPVQEIEALRERLSRLSRASLLINANLDFDAVRQCQPVVAGVCLAAGPLGNVPQEGHPAGFGDAVQVRHRRRRPHHRHLKRIADHVAVAVLGRYGDGRRALDHPCQCQLGAVERHRHRGGGFIQFGYRPAWAGPVQPMEEWDPDLVAAAPKQAKPFLQSLNTTGGTWGLEHKPAGMTTAAPGINPSRWED